MLKFIESISVHWHGTSPGWVGATDMGSTLVDFVARHGVDLENVPIEKSAAGCMKVLNGLTIEDSGWFFNFDGTKIPF